MAEYIKDNSLEDQLITLLRSGAPDFAAAEKLIAMGADVNAKGGYPGESVLSQILEGYWWSDFGDNIENMDEEQKSSSDLGPNMCSIIRFFLARGFDVHRDSDEYGAGCLSALVFSGTGRYMIDATKILLDAGAKNVPCDEDTPQDAFGMEGSFLGSCQGNHEGANLYEAVYQIFEAVEQGLPYDGIDSYEAAIGQKILYVLAERPEEGPVFYPEDLPKFKKDNCFTQNLYFIYDGGFLRTTRYADFWVDTHLPNKPLVDVSDHFAGMVGSRIQAFSFGNRKIQVQKKNYTQPMTVITMENGTQARFSINFGEVEEKDRAAFVEIEKC